MKPLAAFRRSPSICFLVLMMTVSFAAPLAAQQPAPGWVTGRVVDEKTGEPISGAAVQVQAVGRALSGADGRFTLRIPAGAYDAVVRRIGYQPQGARWQVTAGDTVTVTVSMAPEALELAELRVQTNRYTEQLESRLRGLPVSTRSFDEARIARSVSPNAADFVLTEGRLIRSPCAPGGAAVCVRKRGRPVALSVWIDERPAVGGLAELQLFPLDEIGRVEVIDGQTVRVYTRRYLEDSARRGRLAPGT